MSGDKEQDKQYWMACYYNSNNKVMALEDGLNTCKNIMAVMRKRLVDKETELTLLHKVADAARVLSDIWSVGGKPNLSNLRYALAELDKAKEGER